jgi:anti-anti-sigma factor
MGITRSRSGPLTLIAVSQPLVDENLAALRKTVDECLQAGETRLVLDLRDVTAVDSRGLEFFLDARDALTSRGGSLRLVNPGALLTDVLTATRLYQDLEVVCDLEKSSRSLA